MGNEREYVWENKGQLIHLYEEDIYYIHLENRKVYVHTMDAVYVIGTGINELEVRLGGTAFVRTHYSYLVHIRQLLSLRGNEVDLRNGDVVPISRNRRLQVLEQVKAYFRKNKNCSIIG